ncbi:MAG: hypothetical protein ACKO5N_08205 [Sphingomonadales bacterium]
MKPYHIVFLLFVLLFFSCEENNNAMHHPTRKYSNKQKATRKTHTKASVIINPQKTIAHPVFITPEPPEPLPPYDPYDPFDPVPYPIDPPGYIPEPAPINQLSTPKTIRDSLVLFPAFVASFDKNTDAIYKYFDNKIAGTMEWKYLQEIGAEGKIFLRLLIDSRGQVREVTFLRFTSTELEILKPLLTKAALQMPHWTPAKNEQGEAVVCEVVHALRIGIQ